jgi:acyl-CoA thioester hydrolase
MIKCFVYRNSILVVERGKAMLISETEVNVRYAETDQMGVVYHGNYIIWFEIGRTMLIKDLGFSYAELEKEGVISPVIDVQASYKRPLRFGETAKIKTWVEAYDGFRVKYGYEILTPRNEVAVTGFSEHICAQADTFKPIRFGRLYPEWHDAYEKAKK